MDTTDTDSLDEWITEIARSREVPKEELFDQMMSSYWIMAELTGMIEDNQFQATGPDENADRAATDREPAEDAGREAEDGEETAGPTSAREASELLETLDELEALDELEVLDRLRNPDRGEAADTDLERLRRWQRAVGGDPISDHGFHPTLRRLDAHLDRIEARLESERDAETRERRRRVDENLDAHADRLDDLEVAASEGVESLNTLDATVEDLDAEMAEIRSAIETLEIAVENRARIRRVRALSERLDSTESQLSERLDSTETDLSNRLEATESQLSERLEATETDLSNRLAATHRDLTERVTELSEALEATAAEFSARLDDASQDQAERVDHLEERVDDDFENVEAILTYVLDGLDRLDEATSALDGVRENLDLLLEERTERHRLDRLKRDAATLGVRTATCESCEERVDVGLLTEPTCPTCGRQFDRVASRSSWLWRTTAVLRTDSRPTDADPLPTTPSGIAEESLEPANREPSTTADSRPSTPKSTSSFDWLED